LNGHVQFFAKEIRLHLRFIPLCSMRPIASFLSFLLCLLLFFSCKEPKEKISERWVFTHLQTPASKAMAKAFDPAVLDEMFAQLDKKVQGNRLVLEKDGSCFGVLMNCYFTGTWSWSNVGPMVVTQIDYPKKMNLKWQVHKQATKKVDFMVDADNLVQLYQLDSHNDDNTQTLAWIKEQRGEWTITAEREREEFDKQHPDPWSPAMNRWRLKPSQAESRQQVKERVRNHLQFMNSFFDFICRDERFWVSQDWFFSIIKTGRTGTALISEKNIPRKWFDCFYDSAQAREGYYMMKTAFHSDVKVPDEDNSIVFNRLMLAELLRAFDKAYQ
jgi:hypothetical protein